MEYFYENLELPVATLEAIGVTQLNSNVDAVVIDQAATPYSVNQVWVTASNTQQLANMLQADQESLSNDVATLSNHLYIDVEPLAVGASNTAQQASVVAVAASNSWFASSNPLFAATEGCQRDVQSLFNGVTLLQGDQGSLSNHLYLDVEPLAVSAFGTAQQASLVADATSNSWFASSNPLFNGNAWTSNTSYWTSNALPVVEETALAASNAAYWMSNVLPAISSTALAASNAGHWASNLQPSFVWSSNTAVAASNQAFSIGGGGQAQTPDLSFQQLRVTPSNAVTSGTAGIRLGGFTLSNQVIATAGNGDAKVALAVATARRAIESEARPHAMYVHDRLRAFSASAQVVDMSRVIDVGGWSITANAASFRVPRTGTYQLSPYFLTSGAITLRVNGGSESTLVSGQTSLVAWKANDLLELLATSPTLGTVYFELHVAMI